jgi:F-type H+-transporting ATPase subunit gamma
MQTKAIKAKIKATNSIKKITRTMEMVSVAKMKKAINVADTYKTFSREAERILSILSSQRDKTVFNTPSNNERGLYIIIGGQKGLAGAYNSNVYRFLHKELKDKKADFIAIGKYGEKISKKFVTPKNKLLSSHIDKNFTMSDVRNISRLAVKNFKNGVYGKVDIVFTDFKNISSSAVKQKTLLPFTDTAEINRNDLDYTFEPNIHRVFERSSTVLIENLIMSSYLSSLAAEHASRMIAMKAATDNASELLSDLKLWYNKVRQNAITQEIAEISAGAASLSKN